MRVPRGSVRSLDTGRRCLGGLIEPLIELVEILQSRANSVGLFNALRYGFQRLVAISSDADHDGFVSGNPAALNQFFGDGHLGSASGFSEDPFGSREQLDAFEDFLIRDALTPAAGFAYRLKDIVAVGGIADGD